MNPGAEYEVAVAGGGPAGLTAALFAARHGRSTVALAELPGGPILSVTKVEDYPGFPEGVAGYDLCPYLQEQAMAAGAEFRMTSLTGLGRDGESWTLTTGQGPVTARTVILATGSRPRSLGVPGETRLAGHGISHCASCDGPLNRDKAVGVVGGGDSALQEALELTSFTDQVVVFHRGDAFGAQAAYRDRVLESPRIRVRFHTVVEEVLGEDRVAGVRVREHGQEPEDVELSALFVYVGSEPQTSFLDGLLELDPGGYVPTDPWMRTNLPGLYAVGSIRTDSAGQAISAAGDGATAAVAAHRDLG